MTTPVTGRSSFNLFSPQQDLELGREAFEQIKSESRLVRSGPQYDMVQRCMARLVAVADDEGWEWETIVIDEPNTVNAFALPGGKMAVYTGILNVAQSETGLAVVLGHEIGHVVARHGTERMSRSSFSHIGVELISSLLGAGDYAGLFQAGAQVLLELPFSRSHESESDEIGLIYMAQAGYDPREAPRFWQRMESLGGAGTPEFLSTHPSAETRQSRLNELLPRALQLYEGSGEASPPKGLPRPGDSDRPSLPQDPGQPGNPTGPNRPRLPGGNDRPTLPQGDS